MPGLYEEAKQLILQFACSSRHGLIPNLLDAGNNSRFNSRDACWWFLKAIRDYCLFTKSYDILQEDVEMQFLSEFADDHLQQKQKNVRVVKKLHDVVQHIFQTHYEGIAYREWNAGSSIDWHMQNEGFNVLLKMDHETGFIVGGNQKNCLTWMDKMGSSAKAGNKGIPATSRYYNTTNRGAALFIALFPAFLLCLDKRYIKRLFLFLSHSPLFLRSP